MRLEGNNAKVENMIQKIVDNINSENRIKNKTFETNIKSLEQVVSLKLPAEKLERYEKELNDFVNSVSMDISSFNRSLNFMEGTIAANTQYIEGLKKKDLLPKFSLKFKDDCGDKSEIIRTIEKTQEEFSVFLLCKIGQNK